MEDALEETYEDDSKTASTHSNSASGGSRGSSSRSSNCSSSVTPSGKTLMTFADKAIGSRCRLQAKKIGGVAVGGTRSTIDNGGSR